MHQPKAVSDEVGWRLLMIGDHRNGTDGRRKDGKYVC